MSYRRNKEKFLLFIVYFSDKTLEINELYFLAFNHINFRSF